MAEWKFEFILKWSMKGLTFPESIVFRHDSLQVFTWFHLILYEDMYEGTIGDVRELGVVESFKAKRQMLTSAAEAAEMILRVDDIIKCAPR